MSQLLTKAIFSYLNDYMTSDAGLYVVKTDMSLCS